MSEFNFPLKYEQVATAAADYIPKNTKILSAKNFYQAALSKHILPMFDLSGVTDISYLFSKCSNLISVPLFDTSNVTRMDYMFNDCSNLISVPLFDTSNVTRMDYMFYSCKKLVYAPNFDTSNVTNMMYMFGSCSKLLYAPNIDTSNVTDMTSMFYGCSVLTSIPLLYCGKIVNGGMMNIFSSNTMTTLVNLGGFKDLGKVSSFNKPSYFLKNCANLTKESVLNVLNNLYDRATAGYGVVTLPFNSASLALLTDEEKAIATNKGWTLATS